MDDLFLAVPLFFVTGFWLSRHGRKKEKLKVNLEEPKVIVEEPKVSTSAKKDATDWTMLIFFGVCIAWFVYAFYLKDDTLTPQERHTKCVNQTNIVVDDLIDEALEDPSTAFWRYEYNNIYQYANALRKRLYRECMTRSSP
ncbi:hypothetical protein OAJ10_03055 [Paracoccaceae bacterium]|nr:hypothetical protein [Paracoccaceae bacterium]